jgi:predicted solute-binding protein
LPKLRISVVQYLNTSPLVWGFTRGLLAGKYDLSFTVPSQCAEALRAREVDIAIIPAIEYQRIDDLVILPDLAIASKRRVRSLLLISKVPISGAKSIALDRSSRSTQALTKILCARHWQIAPKFQEMAPDLAAMLAANDAALLIGDPALRVSLAIESASRLGSAGVPAGVFSSLSPSASDSVEAGFAPPSPSSSPVPPAAAPSANGRRGTAPPCPSSPHSAAAPEICAAATLGLSPATLSQTLTKEGREAKHLATEKLYVYDIVEQWRVMTGLSAVLAVWAARPSVATPEVVADFHASRAFGLLNLPELCDEAAAQLQLPAPALHSYLTDNIDFTLDTENVAALTRFFVEAHALDLTPASKPVLLAPGPKPVILEPTAIASPRGSLNGRALDTLYENRKRDREL